MIYEEYELYKLKYYNAQKDYDKILNEKEKLFAMTQPNATDYSKEKTLGGIKENTFDTYLIQKEKDNIDQRLKEAYSILVDRKMLFEMKRVELEKSNDWYDIAYKYKYIDNLPVSTIKNKMPYCRSSIYGILKKIRKNVSLDKIGQKL